MGEELKSAEDFAADLAGAVEKLLGDDARATAILGAVVNPFILERLDRAGDVGKTVLASRAVTHPEFADATVRTPLIAAVDATDARSTRTSGSAPSRSSSRPTRRRTRSTSTATPSRPTAH